MPPKSNKISLIYFVVVTLLLVGLVPIVLTGWFLSDKSGTELRAVENRYQTQLVQEKARQIEMFGQRYSDLVGSLARAFELTNNLAILSAPQTEEKLGVTLRENPNLLAINVKPYGQESVSVFRSEIIKKDEIEKITEESLKDAGVQKMVFGEPQKLPGSGEPVITITSPIIIDNKFSATVTAIVSLREISRNIVGVKSMSEEELWKADLPIIFVVNEKGNAVFHPDVSVVASQKPLTNLKIVQEWQAASNQIQSALVPFTAEFNGNSYDMIGAYSTARVAKDLNFGVITMQSEKKAFASVAEMRWQTWMISLAFALTALLIGFIATRFLTTPLLKLVAAARKISTGDFSTRVETKNITEIVTLGDTFNTMSDRLEVQIDQLAKAAEENHELFVGTVKALAAAIDGKDRYTRGHSERVSRVSVAIGQRLGMDEQELETLRISSLLHDVGKIAIDDSILKKPAALTDDEFTVMKTHPLRGYKIMSQIPAMREYLPGIYMHHEMVNGMGYPQGLKDEDIPMQAKIVSVADTFDAMTIDRPYSKGMMLPDALDRIKSFVGTRYDARVVEALIAACDDGQVGIGVVRLKSVGTKPSPGDPAVTEKKVA